MIALVGSETPLNAVPRDVYKRQEKESGKEALSTLEADALIKPGYEPAVNK